MLRRAVPFVDYAWLLTDPETTVGSAPMADVRCLGELPRLIALRYRSTVNRWTEMSTTAASLEEATAGHPGLSVVWRDLLQAHGVGDVATVVFADPWGLWGWVDLWRSTGDAPFSAAELAVLAECAPSITAALRECRRRQIVARAAEEPPAGMAVLVLSADLDVLAQTPQTTEYLRLLVPPEAGRSPIPAGAYNVAAQLLAVEQAVDDHPPRSRTHLHAGTWVTMRADRIGDGAPAERRDIAVTIEPTTPRDRLGVVVRAVGLSPRESELVGHVLAGSGSGDIARRMFLSPHTVQDHLKSVFAKTGVHSRRDLVALLHAG
jgi:DNA-binding CsgD family transcriptional regulator